ncbi:dynein light chain 1, axonemal-like [Teleopsis dalmanni]|uniref:dynein light chain 1, axonemal-like n=1 Tax=Teleopsis dalmanni TaxID=139649 RepID=UPI0018CEFADA|nr:dynein light chain 1, axonemal-like [Teleopsis dalmanni]
MSKPTTIKEAITNWQEKFKQAASEAHDVSLQLQWPPIEKMDSSLSELKECRKLSLSTNAIEKITGLSSLTNLKILALSRNRIKHLTGIETLANTLEELWISYNLIENLKPIEAMKILRVFYVSHNNVKDWMEFNRMAVPPLQAISFVGNPLQETLTDDAYKAEVKRRLPRATTLDGDPLIR